MLWYIEALRTLAVLAVVVYHSAEYLLIGGFAGVDVFFVVSGYLMSYLSLRSDIKSFNGFDFIWRRFSRLWPALVFVSVPVVLINTFYQPFFYFSDYLDSFLSSLLFVSNIKFWFGAGYFNVEQQYDPLLHTWTLGIEFQYYLAFSVAVFLMRNMPRSFILIVFGAASFVSFFLSMYFSSHFSAVFYNLPTRGWEFGMGAFLAYATVGASSAHSDHIPSILKSNVLVYVSLLILSVVIFSYESHDDRLLYTLSICVCTLAVLFFGSKSTKEPKSSFLLDIVIFVGGISYTIYLVHYPATVFLRPYFGNAAVYVFVVISFSIIISLLIKPLELKLRRWLYSVRNVSLRFKVLFIYLLIPLILFLSESSISDLNASYNKFSLRPAQHQVQDFYLKEIAARNNAMSDFNERNSNSCWKSYTVVDREFVADFKRCYARYGNAVLIVGDSHSEGLFLSLSHNPVNKASFPFVFGINSGGCRYSLGSDEGCFDGVLEFVSNNSEMISGLIYHQAGFYLFERAGSSIVGRGIFDSTPPRSSASVIPSVRSIKMVSDALLKFSEFTNTIFAGPWNDPFINRRSVISNGCDNPPLPQSWVLERYRLLDSELMERKEYKYFSVSNALALDFTSDFIDCNSLYWVDTDHMSVEGHKRFSKRLILRDILIDG